MGLPLVRLLDTGAGEPAHNMAVDEVLLAGAASRPTLRLYAWARPAISLGCFQPVPATHPPRVALVRRITGGGAILHRDELTFAMAARIDLLTHPANRGAVVGGPRGGAARGVRASFDAVNRAVARGLERLGLRVASGQETEEAGAEPFLCFERRSSTDLLVRGRKLVGSAQRRTGRDILQHGSIPLGAEDDRGAAVTVSAAAGRPVGYDEVAGAIARGFEDALGVDLRPGALDPAEVEAAARLAREKYGAEWWTARR